MFNFSIPSFAIHNAINHFYSLSEKSKAENNYEGFVDDLDLPLLDLSIILAATDNFSEVNKIGEGGFGPVYWVIQYLDTDSVIQD